jgi:hypothetical protein
MTGRFATALTLGLALTAGAALADGPVAARGEPNSITDNSVKTRPSDFSLLGFLPFYGYGFGIGVEGRYEIPIVANGFIPSINNSISIEPSFGISYNGSGVSGSDYHLTVFSPAVYGIWSFWFSEPFRAYAGLGLGYNIAVVSGYNGSDSFSSFYWDPVVGIFYKFAPAIAFRAEAGREAIKAGVSFFF